MTFLALFHDSKTQRITLPTSHVSAGLMRAFSRRHQNSQSTIQADRENWFPGWVEVGEVHNRSSEHLWSNFSCRIKCKRHYMTSFWIGCSSHRTYIRVAFEVLKASNVNHNVPEAAILTKTCPVSFAHIVLRGAIVADIWKISSTLRVEHSIFPFGVWLLLFGISWCTGYGYYPCFLRWLLTLNFVSFGLWEAKDLLSAFGNFCN